MTNNKASESFIAFDHLDFRPSPFEHFLINNSINPEIGEKILSWFEKYAEWEDQNIEDFYTLSNLRLREHELPNDLKFLASMELYATLCSQMESVFAIDLDRKIDVSAHRLRAGHRMGVHTDYGPVGQTHRLLIQLNRGWPRGNGGLLMLFDEVAPTAPSPLHRYYLPAHRSAFGFEISTRSFHAISPVHAGERFTLVYSFTQSR